MNRISIPIRDHNRIRTSPAIVAAVEQLAAEIADDANRRAGVAGYQHDVNVGTDRARAHVWPEDKAAHEERQHAYLLQIAAERGAQ